MFRVSSFVPVLLVLTTHFPNHCNAQQPSTATEDLLKGAEANNHFACELYKQVAREQKAGKNIVLSPYSVRRALAMAFAGAQGRTAAEMAAVGRFGEDQDKFHADSRALSQRLLSSDKSSRSVFKEANGIWIDDRVKLRSRFEEVVKAHYAVTPQKIALGDSVTARGIINEWVSEQTERKIRTLIPEDGLSKDAAMVLANAVYMRGDWVVPFDPAKTRKDIFLGTSGRSEVPFMQKSERISYCEKDGTAVAALDFSGGDLSLMIVMPSDSRAFGELEKNLSPATFQAWQRQLRNRTVDLRMPRLTVKHDERLRGSLESLGMRTAFSSHADFRGMNEGEGKGLLLSDVLHSASLEITERGAEGAAATAVVASIPVSIGLPDSPVTLTVDRPFVFTVYHAKTRLVLFMGRVLECRSN